ncbi:unannotated protein [freshwater metagenome]|uniref:Unannotated protein n=1 Tax=freshwater metagenome TaxID=449393 RepID=A0A6J7DNY9_9ZZZZ
MPSCLNSSAARLLSSSRMTTFSPNTVASDDTRTSMSLPSTVIENCPSWGLRRSTMFMPPRILYLLTSAA